MQEKYYYHLHSPNPSKFQIKMAHRKSLSYPESVGSVPFSWEEKPGIPKFSLGHQSCAKKAERSTNSFIQQPLQKSFSSHFHSPLRMMASYKNSDMKISPPPRMAQPPSRSPSMKGFWGRRQDDPFAAAIKECTKSIRSHGDPSGKKKNLGSTKDRNQNFIFSCNKSCEVKEGNLVRLAGLPPLPSGRNKGHPK